MLEIRQTNTYIPYSRQRAWLLFQNNETKVLKEIAYNAEKDKLQLLQKVEDLQHANELHMAGTKNLKKREEEMQDILTTVQKYAGFIKNKFY